MMKPEEGNGLNGPDIENVAADSVPPSAPASGANSARSSEATLLQYLGQHLGIHQISHHLHQFNNSDVNSAPFIGRLGWNGIASVKRNSTNAELLREVPDAAPLMPLKAMLSPRPFLSLALWKAALMEGMGTFMLVWVTIYSNSSPNVLPEAPTARWGTFNNAAFLGPLIGGILNFMFLTLFTFCFGGVSGAHLNPTITIATLFARLCSLPRAILYVAFQTAGGAAGGMMARAAIGTRDFKVGGCFLYPEIVPVSDAFAVEFMSCIVLLFFAFGVGLDPRQKQIVGPTLGPFLIGMTLGSLSFGTGFARYGYGGASLNPARCFGTYVGTRFPTFHWIHWYVLHDVMCAEGQADLDLGLLISRLRSSTPFCTRLCRLGSPRARLCKIGKGYIGILRSRENGSHGRITYQDVDLQIRFRAIWSLGCLLSPAVF
jgi:glycerol uptake facilitator-like aquaporin